VLKGIAANGNAKAILFLGSNLGNMLDHNAARFLDSLNKAMNYGDRLLLGLDQKKSREVVLPAYNDAGGITSAFNLNLLTRINRELNANFIVNQFEHSPEYDEEEGVAKSFICSKVKQSVSIGALQKSFHFEKGERIHTEISRKYNKEILSQLIKKTDLKIEEVFIDSNELFTDYILAKR
jgi:L-histidine N-alpha-methyltransferase